MNFERDKGDIKQNIGVGRKALAYRIIKIQHWGKNGRLASVKLKTARKVLKNLSEDPRYLEGYDHNIYFQLDRPADPDEFPSGGHHPSWYSIGIVHPKDLAGKNVVWEGRLYTFVPKPSEE